MTDEDKKLIAGYMGWIFSEYGGEYYYIPKNGKVIYFDLNDAALCLAEMQKRGDWNRFLNHGFNSLIDVYAFMAHNFIATLFRAENFFGAMAAWLREVKK